MGTGLKPCQQGKDVYSEQVDPVVELRKVQQLHAQAERARVLRNDLLVPITFNTNPPKGLDTFNELDPLK